MSNSSKHDGEKPLPKPTRSQVILMFGTIADTTWRMFIPIIGLTIVGVWADNSFQTKPWMTVVGMTVGIIIAGALVKRQLQKASK